MPFTNMMPYTTRSREMVIIVACDVLTFVLRRCRSCASTAGNGSLYGGAMPTSRRLNRHVFGVCFVGEGLCPSRSMTVMPSIAPLYGPTTLSAPIGNGAVIIRADRVVRPYTPFAVHCPYTGGPSWSSALHVFIIPYPTLSCTAISTCIFRFLPFFGATSGCAGRSQIVYRKKSKKVKFTY